MAVNENDPVEALPYKRVRYVIAEVDENGFPDVYRSRKAHVVLVESIMDHRRSEDQAPGPPRGFLCDVLDQHIIGVHRQMVSVLLDCSHGDHDHGALGGPFLYLSPCQLTKEMLRHMGWSSYWIEYPVRRSRIARRRRGTPKFLPRGPRRGSMRSRRASMASSRGFSMRPYSLPSTGFVSSRKDPVIGPVRMNSNSVIVRSVSSG